MAKTFLVTVRLSDDATLQDVQECVPAITKTAASLAKGQPEIAFRSSDSGLFGILIETDKPVGVIRSAFDTCVGIRNQDAFWLVEIGPETASSQGMTRPMTWVQRRY